MEVFSDCESDMAVGIRKVGNTTRVTAGGKFIVQQIAGSSILILELEAKKSDL
jgi:hypothetical protein